VRTYAIIAGCVVLIIAGFFFAARQHFLAMDYGMKNSRLRKQVDDLEAEKRRLMLAREVSLSPYEILKAAKRSGLEVPESIPTTVVQAVSATKQKAKPAAPHANVPQQPTAVPAAATATVPRVVPASETRPDRERVVKAEKKAAATE
jgi:hypothetical protein